MISLPLILFLLIAGDSGTVREPKEARVPGIVDFGAYGTKEVLLAPDSVRAGEEFQVAITTFGGGCDRRGDASVVMSATGASVIVYDFSTATHPSVICTAEVKRLPHSVTLRLEKPGAAVIRVWGRQVGPQTPPFGLPAVIEHRVTVK